MKALATVNVETGEIVASHDARSLVSPQQGVEYIRAFQKAVASARALGKDRTTVNKYAEQLVRHVRETGRLISELPKSPGKRTDRKPNRTDAARFCGESGISRDTAER